MESLEDKVLRFISAGYGSGYGDGSGSGYGDGSGSGYGYGSGSGYGYGYGSGYGDGYGYGYGDGSGIKEFAGSKVWLIDGIQTLIYSVYSNFAKGAILESDFTLKYCYIVKVENCFAHGTTLHEAYHDARSKALRKRPLEDRVKSFVEAHKSNVKYSGKDLFVWHNILTGSCKMGRESFCRQHQIDIDKDEFFVVDFITLTQNAYGGDIIKQLKPYYA